LPPADEMSSVGGGARHGWYTRCGQAAWVFMIWCRRIPVHRGLPRVAWPGCLPGHRKLMSSAGRGSRLASLSGAAAAFTMHNRPQDGSHNSPQESARPAAPVTTGRGQRGRWLGVPSAFGRRFR
jgi:hypothetical protein